MPRTGDNIYKRKDGRWEGRFVKGRRNGRTIFGSVFGKTRRETKTKLTIAQYEWSEGLLDAKRNRTKLSSVSDAWLKESEAFSRNPQSPSTGTTCAAISAPASAKRIWQTSATRGFRHSA